MYPGFIIFLAFTSLWVVAERRLAHRLSLWLVLSPVIWSIGAAMALLGWFAWNAELPLKPERLHEILAGAALPVTVLLFVSAKRRRRLVPLVVLPLALLVYGDILYFRFFQQVIPLSALRSTNQLSDVWSVIPALLRFGDSVNALALLSALAVYVVGKPAGSDPELAGAKTNVLVALLLFWLVGPPLIGIWRNNPAVRRHPTTLAALPSAGVLYAHLYDFALHARWLFVSDEITTDELTAVRRELAARAEWASGVEHFGVAHGQNLLLIQLESLSTWLAEAEVGGQPVMPFLQSLRSRGLYFPTVLDQTNHGGTADAEYAVLNSLHPLPEGAVCFSHSGNEFLTVAHALRDAGYSTLSAHAYEGQFWNRAMIFPAYGFESSLFDGDFGPGEEIGWGLADHAFLLRLIPHLSKLPEPFFALAITLSLHVPFGDLPHDAPQLPLGDLADIDIGPYLILARYVDGAMQRFFAELDANGLTDNTVIALYGDHTVDVVGQHRLVPMEPGANGSSRYAFVPLLVLLPGQELRGTEEDPIGQIDIGPTLLHLLGIERPVSFLGRPALRPIGFAARWAPQTGLSDHHMVQGDRCFTRNDGLRTPAGLCEDLARQTSRELAISRNITIHDLVPQLLAEASR